MEVGLSVEDISEEGVLSYLNDLLERCGVDLTINHISECKSDLFLILHNAIIGHLPPGALIDCNSVDAQIHNVKCIIETLSDDLLKVDLSHISPVDVVKGDLVSIYNLVEILDGLLDYLLEKGTSESDSGDDGDIDSDQLSDHAKALAFETIQMAMSQRRDSSGTSLADTDDLIKLGNTFVKDSSEKGDFSFLKPELSMTPDLNQHGALSDHSLLDSDVSSQHDTIPRTDFSGIPSESESYKSLPRELLGISSTLSQLKVDLNDVPTKLILDNDSKIADSNRSDKVTVNIHSDCDDNFKVTSASSSSSSSTLVVSDSGASMDSERRRHALDVVLDEEKTSFPLKRQDNTRKEPVDVADGGGRKSDKRDENASNSLRYNDVPPPKARDWQAMLDNLQRTVEESRRIRDEYFSSFRSTRSQDVTLTNPEPSAGGMDSTITEDSLEESTVEPPVHRKKNVRFQDTVSTKTAKELAQFRELLQKEKALQDEKNKILSRSYKDHLDEVRAAEDEKLGPLRRKVSKSGKQVKSSMQKPKRFKVKSKRNLTDAAKLSWLSPSRTHPQRMRQMRPTTPKRTTASSAHVNGLDSINEHDLLPKLLEEFPQLELPPATLNDMWHKQFRQIEHLTKATYDHRNKKKKSDMQLHQAHMKHELLTKIMEKEHDHTRRLRDIRERVAKQKEAQRLLRDRRLQAARVRKYYKDYHLQMRSRMIKRRTKEERVEISVCWTKATEEKIFKRLFEDGLEIQRARLRELRKYARDKRAEQQKRQIDEIHSLENYYKDQFNILADTLAKERSDLKSRDEAQVKLVRQMKKGLRQKMEKEIESLQDMIVRDDDDAYYREIEADRLRRQLQLSTYHAKFHD